MMNNRGYKRLQQELKTIYSEVKNQIINNGGKIKDNFVCVPNPADLYEWYFVVFGLKDTPYDDGYYLGRLKFPSEYPYKAPAIFMLSETGRFKVNQSICLSISEHHPESWSPMWSCSSIILGLISFMVTEDSTYGSIRTSVEHKR